MQLATHAIGNMHSWQNVQLATHATGNTCNWLHMQPATRATGNMCNWQHFQQATTSFYLKPWPVRLFEDWHLSLYIVAASESDEGLVLKVLWWGTAASLFGKRPSIFHLLTITDKVLALFCPRDWEGGDSRSQTVHIFIFLISWSRSGLVLNIMFHCRSRFLNELQFWQVWEKIADNSFSSKIVFFTNFCLRHT